MGYDILFALVAMLNGDDEASLMCLEAVGSWREFWGFNG